MKTILEPWIKLKEHLDRKDYDLINSLQEQCISNGHIVLKLELDYKLGLALVSTDNTGIQKVNEFMYFDGQILIGYIGICSFGGSGTPLEITGMVHPDYRRQGIFTMLHKMVMAECKRRNSSGVLLLCDRNSDSSQKYLKKIGAVYKNSEYEMYLQQDRPEPHAEQLCGITFRKATNADAHEIARQDAIYFGDYDKYLESGLGGNDSETNLDNSVMKEDMRLPEDEEKRGMTIYLVEKGQLVIGKVNLEINSAEGGIFGLGVLPEYRDKGLGRAILLKAIEKLKEAKTKTIMLQVAAENATALNLYKSCGFIETSTMDYFKWNE